MLHSGTVSDTPSQDESQQPYGRFVPLLAEFATLPADDPRRRALHEELVTGYLPIVRNIARRYSGRGEPTADLEQAGSIGLLSALDRFDPGRGIDFLSFAIPTITGEMRRHFRDRTWSMRVPRRLKDLQAPIRQTVTSLSRTLGRSPRPTEIAASLDIPVQEVIEALNAQQAYSPQSLDAPAGGTDVPLGSLLGRVDAELETAEYRETLRRALDELPERERTVVLLRFFGDLTQTQIAEQVGVSQMHVSRLLAKTLLTLRARLDTAD